MLRCKLGREKPGESCRAAPERDGPRPADGGHYEAGVLSFLRFTDTIVQAAHLAPEPGRGFVDGGPHEPGAGASQHPTTKAAQYPASST